MRHVLVAAGGGRSAGLRAGLPAPGDLDPHRSTSQQVVEDAEATNFLPAAPIRKSRYPTTIYKTKKIVSTKFAAGRLFSRRTATRPLAAGA